MLTKGCYEPTETDPVRKRLQPGDTFIDVGASIGWFTVIASQLVGENGRVIAFEPEPTSFAPLKRNVEANGCRNVVLVQKALSNEPGIVSLHLARKSKGTHSIVLKKGYKTSIEVEAVRLDDYLQEHESEADFVKIDIEGAEGMVLDGMRETLEACDNLCLMMEYAPRALAISGYDPDELLHGLADRGFQICYIDAGKRQVIPSSPVEVLTRVSDEDQGYTNLFLERTEATVAEVSEDQGGRP